MEHPADSVLIAPRDSLLLLLSALLLGWAVHSVHGHLARAPSGGAGEWVRAGAASGTSSEPVVATPVSPAADKAAEDSRLSNRLAELRLQVLGRLPVDPEDTDPHDTDRCLHRFLRAVGGDVAFAAERLIKTANWRFERKPWSWACTYCERVPGHHTWRQFGHDKIGRPVVYSCLAQAATHRYTAACAVEHIVYAIENASRTMPDNEDGWLWVCDFSGFSMRAVDLRMASGVIHIVGEHYPERLALFLVVNTPIIFTACWRAISTILDPNTTKKAKFVSSCEETRAFLDEILPEEEANWAMTELTLNLQRPLPFEQSCNGFWRPPPAGATHDPRATRSHMQRYFADRESARAGKWLRRHMPHPNVALQLAGKYDEPEAASDSDSPTPSAAAAVECAECAECVPPIVEQPAPPATLKKNFSLQSLDLSLMIPMLCRRPVSL
ncbi:CRAL-TRIO domain-containing protein [Pavlovales sp. CCMP2436]|nr:CRAL-TRIO domain-containing protein [Pavlovales sp. CCMP2436]|mmetsp:Transcript_5114/g.13288  ORF Transcript_5114/g.13288 Transcript_5114/m.13288 type:complete len:440 (-) Transcript_5114:322-1641(-)